MQKRKTSWPKRAIGVLCAGAFAGGLLVGGSLTTAPAPAQALDLPTWDDVQAAKGNEAAAAKKVTEIEGLIKEGEKELDRLRNLHATKLEELNVADANAREAADRAQQLRAQAEQSQKEAEEAADRAGVLVAQMYRSGGVDRSMELFLDADEKTADALLERMASMSKATERNTQLSEEAQQAANTADTLGKQAKAAEKEREELRERAAVLEAEAATAAATQGEKVAEQEGKQRVLETQLAALKDTTSKTVDGYEERLRIEEEQRRKEAERLARIAEEYRKQQEELARQQREQANNGGGNTGGGNTGGGNTGGGNTGGGNTGGGNTGGGNGGISNGWVIPTSNYYISDYFAPPGRPNHTGIDLATACYTPIVAAASGTVGMAYWDPYGGGNMVTVNHSTGWQTRYAHMAQWALVGQGQQVSAGQVIGYVGTTGSASTGCHLHFEMRLNQDEGWYGFVNPAFYINF